MALVSCDDLFTPIAVTISGTAMVGQTITATSSGNGFEWGYSTADGSYFYSWTVGTGEKGIKYTVTKWDAGLYIQARRYQKSTDEYIYSNTIGPVAYADN
jgi:hypothetical protein